MKKVYILLLTVLFAAISNAQTTLISPTGDGGFENGATFLANGWTVVNGATNQWFVGAVATPSAGTNSAYISDNVTGTTYNYNVGIASTVHFYRDVTFPAGETNIVLTFKWKGQGEGNYDYVTVYSMPTGVTPTFNNPAGAFQSWLNIPTAYAGAVVHASPPNLNLQSAYQTQTICLPAAYAGTTRRLVFMFSNDPSLGTEPPASVDEISLVTSLPPTIPANSPAGLILTAVSTSQINGSFTAAAGAPDGYLVVRYPTGAVPANPVNGTTYIAGASLGTGKVVSANAATAFSATGLSPSTTYDFYTYSYNSAPCAGGPLYKTTAPLFGTSTTLACSGLAGGTYTVGPTGTYASLTAVIAALSSGTTGPVTFELQSTYLPAVETFPVTFTASACPLTGGVTIRPQTGAVGLSITSANATGTILFDGGSNITFDGRAGGAGPSQLSISNTTTTGYALQLINSARFNTFKYCTIAGVNTGTTSGIIVFSNAVGFTTGNSNNTIDNCDIRDGATTPLNLIYVSGNTADYASHNLNNTISNCNIHDWFNATSTTAGAGINIVGGASDWSITGNSFYQSVLRTFTMVTATDQGGLFVASTTFGTNFTITGNFFGGSAPLCGGTAWTYTGGATGTPTIRMLRFSSAIGAYSNISNNTFANINVTTSSTSTSESMISHLNGNVNIDNNTIGSQSATGNILFTLASTSTAPQFIAISTGTGASVHTINITNNNIGGITVGTSSTGAVSLRLIYGQPVLGSVMNITGNFVGGTVANSIQQLTGTATLGVGSLFGILLLNPSVGDVITNNTIRNLTITTTFAGPSLTGINVQASGGRHTITGNTVHSLTTNGLNAAINNAASVVGITMTGSLVGGSNISGNTIYNLTNTNTTVAGWINGMYFATSLFPQPNTLISKNFVHSINLASSVAGVGMVGIFLPNTGNAMVTNNMVRLGIDASGASIITPVQIVGIWKASSGFASFLNNSVYIGGTGVATGTVSSFAFVRTVSPTSGTDSLLNNILYNARSNASGTGSHVGISLNLNTTINSNFNDIFVDGTGGLFGVSTSNYATLAAWKAGTSLDGSSVSGNPQYLTPGGTSATVNLHINTGVATVVEQGGVVLANVPDDIDNQARAGLTPSDIGADAGNFLLLDQTPPVMVFTPLPFTCSTGDRTLSGVTITDATGVPIVPILKPRIYYKKNAGAYFSQAGTLTSGSATNGQWSFTIVAADMGGLVATDVVSYYIIAQDNLGNIASNAAGVVATDVNTILTHPPTPNTYTVVVSAVSSGTYTVGAAGTFTTLTAAVAAYNTGCLTGPVIFSLLDVNYAAETFPITITANPYANSTNTLTIKPTLVGTTITGTSASALIVLNGADWITINGSISATANTVCPFVAASRNLTLTNTNVSTTSAVIWLQTNPANTTDGATNNNIWNLNLVGSGNLQTLIGVGSGTSTISTASLGIGNNNNTYVNNNISATQYGIVSQGQSLGTKNTGTVINQNLINTVSPNNVGKGGILVGFENGVVISGNNISEISFTSTPDVFGIAVGGFAVTTTTFTGNEVTNAVISKNVIGSIRNTGTFSAVGIFVVTALSGTNLIANNTISGVSANATPGDFTAGMLLGGGNGSVTQVYYNTITMTNVNPQVGGTNHSYALAVGGTTPNPVMDIRNNILVNYQNNGTGNNYAIGYGYNPHTNLTSDHNDYYVAAGATFFIGATGSLSAPTNQATIASLQAATLKDGSAQNVLPVFVSATDLHLSSAAGVNWCLNNKGVAVSVTDDIDCQVRNNPPDIGADEFVATGTDIATPASQTVCSAIPITTIVLSGGAASYSWTRDNTVAATGIAASGTGNISGTLTNTTASPVTVTFTITPLDANGCAGPATFTATVTVNPNNTITLTSAAGTNAQTVCINTPITNITYATTGATGATFSGLPAGVTGNWAANVVTISGSPTTTVGSPFSYTVTLTGGCGSVTATGTITVNPNNTITLTSAAGTNAQTVCINTAITNITYSTTGATGATFSGLPAGVTGNWAANVVTISGSPTTTVGSPFSYTVTLTGGCGSVTATGTITVTPNNTITLTSAPGTNAQTVCINTAITNITYSTTGATGATFSGLPAGVTGNWAANVVTISGSPTTTVGSPFSYTVTLTGGCGVITATGTITVTPNNTITLTSAPGTNAQTVCINTAITNITYSTTGATGATFSGLPAGVTGSWAANVVTISGSPTTTVGSPFSYTVTLTGGCGVITATGTITVTPNNTITLTSAPGTNAQSVCLNSPIANITYSTTGATGATFSGLPAGVTGNWAANVVTISGTPTTTVGSPFSYTITLTGGCGIITATGTITVRPLPIISSTQVEPTTCASADGSITLTLSGAAGPYTFAWTGSGVNPTSQNQTGLTVGNYSVTVTAANGCTATANFALAGPGGCSICPTIPNFATTPAAAACAGSNVTFTASGLTNMGTTYGIQFKYSAAALPNPYVGGTVIATVPNGSLTSGGTVATANSASIPVGSYFVYAILSPTPVDPACRPAASVNLTIGAVPDVNQPANQVVCNNFPTAAVNFSGSVPGTVFNWTNNTPSIGLAASGAGNIASFTALNATTSPVVATVIVTPSYTTTTPVTATFNFTGAMQTFTVPAGVTSINIQALGAQGGSGAVGGAAVAGGTGGLGASATGTLAVTPGQVLNIFVGGQGATPVGGFNGGGNGGNQNSGGGGGASDVRAGGVTPANRVITAGGGGGGGRGGCDEAFAATGGIGGNGGNGGGGVGNNGASSPTSGGVAGGGFGGNFGSVQGALGAAGIGCGGFLGAPGSVTATEIGANGGGGQTCCCFSAGSIPGGGGGGGGQIGGGGAGGGSAGTTGCSGNSKGAGGGGGGGSSYTSGVTSGTTTPGVQSGNGQVVITWLAASITCTGTPRSFTITVNPTPAATISYTGSPYCSNAGTATVTRTGTAGGTYSAAPAGLTLNAANGDVTLGTSTPGTYTVTYTIAAAGGCAIFTTTTSITITALPAATINYAGSPYCSNAGTATVTRTGTAGGTYSAAPAGLTLNAANGDVTLGTSTPGTYTVTYTIAAAGGCPVVTATTSITITALPAATISYTGSPYCSNAGTATVTRTGTAGGTYSAAPAGLTLNAANGDVTLGTSTPGTYTVTYTIAASGGCPVVTATTSITITTLPAATIVYSGSPYCSSGGTATVTRTGTAGGTYSAAPAGLTLNAANGDVTLGTSTPGTYTVTYTIAASGGCPAVTATTSITVTTANAATISYAGTPYCTTVTNAPVTRTGTAGGTYTAAPAGLTINAATGTVNPSTSTPGTYTVTYTMAATGGCPAATATTSITITLAPNMIIFYAGTPYCSNAGTATVSQFGTTGGTYSAAPAGLTINPATGAVTLGTSTPGTYTVTYSVTAPGCGITNTYTTITITAAPNATISYAGSPYCSNAGTANVTLTGSPAGGVYSSTAGLSINAATGAVNLAASTAGTYTVTYTVAASGGCAVYTTTTTITITQLPAATIAYTGSPYCSNAGTATVTRTGTAGGTYSAAPAGLSINAATGDVNLGASTAGTYTVTYTLAAGGGCPAVTATASITITAVPAATISYAGNPFCQPGGIVNVTRTGTAGGTYTAAPAGLVINAANGDINIGTSTPGTYTVTYTLAAGGGCPAVTATTSVTINSPSTAPTAANATSTSLCTPGTVTLSVVGGTLGSGSAWRWYSGSCGGTLVGTGATLVVTVNTTTTYFVRAEGPCNTTTCASVTVAVNVQPTISIAASRTTLLPGQTATLTATFTPAAGNTFIWYRNGVVVPGASGSTLVVTIDGLGKYTARVTTAAGCTALSNEVTIIAEISTFVFVYPNPSTGRFQVRVYNPLGKQLTVIVYKSNTQLVYRKAMVTSAPYTRMDVDLRNVAGGEYNVVVVDSDGTIIGTRKVMIAR